MGYELIPYKTPEDWQRGLVKRVAQRIREDAKAQLPVVLSLAGGSTPLPVYRSLAGLDLDWSTVNAIPGDDRCVPHENEHSNVYQFRQVFEAANGIRILPLTDPLGSDSLAMANAVMHAHPLHFTATVLGMGDDMHTASLFPNTANLAAAIDPKSQQDVALIVPDPLPSNAPYPRITMTAQRLLRSRVILLALKGQDKRDALKRALDLDNPLTAPIMSILGAPGAVTEIHWCP